MLLTLLFWLCEFEIIKDGNAGSCLGRTLGNSSHEPVRLHRMFACYFGLVCSSEATSTPPPKVVPYLLRSSIVDNRLA